MSGGGGAENVRGISELSTVFTVIFVITLLVLLAQLLYILLRRRQTTTNAVSSEKPQLLFLNFFFCFRAAHQTANSSVAASNTNCSECPISSSVELGMGFVDVDVLKLHGVFGQPGFLFTIKEEDEEEEEERAEEDESGGGGTPFATPCDSPAFFTPVESPVHVVAMGWSRDEEMGLAE